MCWCHARLAAPWHGRVHPRWAAEVKMIVPRRPDRLSPFHPVTLTPRGHPSGRGHSERQAWLQRLRILSRFAVILRDQLTFRCFARRSSCPLCRRLESFVRGQLDGRVSTSPSLSTHQWPPASRPPPFEASFRAVQQRLATVETSLRSASPLKPGTLCGRYLRSSQYPGSRAPCATATTSIRSPRSR
jgi:hypothetical protein